MTIPARRDGGEAPERTLTTGSTKTVFANAVTGCFCGETVGVTAWSSTRGAAFARGSGARARFRDLKPNMAPDRRAREDLATREWDAPAGATETLGCARVSSRSEGIVRGASGRSPVVDARRGVRDAADSNTGNSRHPETPFRAGQRLWARARTFGSCDRPPPSRAPRRRDDDHGGRRRETGEARGERRCLLELRAGQPLDAERGVLRLSLSRRLVDLRACARDDDARALRVGVPRLSPDHCSGDIASTRVPGLPAKTGTGAPRVPHHPKLVAPPARSPGLEPLRPPPPELVARMLLHDAERASRTPRAS